jgi:hypothetical protein
MINDINYRDASLDVALGLKHAIAIEDFLPAPGQLTLKTQKEKITILIDKRSLELF